MRSRRPAILLLFTLATVPAVARAQPSLDDRVREEKSYESPQHFWFEFKLGPYIPGIDSEFGGRATPYRDLFTSLDKNGQPDGDGRNLIFNLELDYEVLRKFGTLAVGGSIGYFSNSAQALWDKPDPNTGVTPLTNDRSGSETSLKLLPLAVLVAYRFDVLADRYNIPLVPYFKFGINYTFWWMLLNGDTRTFVKPDGTSVDGKGGTFGWQINTGLALRLDIIDAGAAHALDSEIGINHTYLFFELSHIAADGFGSSSALRLGDTTWAGGLAFEF